MTVEANHPHQKPDDPALRNRTRYITYRVKTNGVENGRTEILDTTVDGGEGEPLIVASFFDRAEAKRFCLAANFAVSLKLALEEMVAAHPKCPMRIGAEGSHARRVQTDQEEAIDHARELLAAWREGGGL